MLKYIITLILVFCTLGLIAQGKFGGGDGSGYSSQIVNAQTLSISLTDFSVGVFSSDQAKIKWATSSEIDNDYFVIEKSNNAQHWQVLATHKARGQANATTDYKLIDTQPFQGVSYYRLKQFDLDGSLSISKIIVLRMPDALQVEVYPNPFEDILHLNTYNSSRNESLLILDSKGILVLKMDKIPTKLELRHLAEGIYLLQIGSFLQKIVKK